MQEDLSIENLLHERGPHMVGDTLSYATARESDFGLAQSQLVGVVLLRNAPAGPLIGGEADELASAVALRTALTTQRRSIAIASGIWLEADRPLITAGPDEVIDEGLAARLCSEHSGKEGVLREVLAVADPDGALELLRRDTSGCFARASAGHGTWNFDSVWRPTGYSKTCAELGSLGTALAGRRRLLLDLANHLELPIANSLFEAHITVDCASSEIVRRFREACGSFGLKAIRIELPEGAHPTHLISASFHRGSLTSVEAEVATLTALFDARGLHVTRQKIEALLRNPMVPASDTEARARPRSEYFEFHVKIAVTTVSDIAALRGLCERFGARLSRNASNEMNDGLLLHFATIRAYAHGRPSAERHFELFLAALRSGGYSLSNILREYTVFDTNASLDDGWFSSRSGGVDMLPCSACMDSTCVFRDSDIAVDRPRPRTPEQLERI